LKYFKTSELAEAVGVHPNTVRLYEQWGLLPVIPRSPKGYRLFTHAHLEQLRLVRIALRCDFAGDIRKSAIEIIKTAASGFPEIALEKAYIHLELVKTERARAEEALRLAEEWLKGSMVEDDLPRRRIMAAAKLLGVTTDTLRNWERNGLIHVPRNPANGYREYGRKEINRLKIIRTLRVANFSIMAVLRMMLHIDKGEKEDARTLLDTPSPEEDIVYATDKWISTLMETEKNAHAMIAQLNKIINPPL
jgi:DNA-binding transcriptional MerR regulator